MAELESSTRRAALLVHGLPSRAQRAVLARLETTERQRILALLDELKNLGVEPALGELLQELARPQAQVERSPRERVAALQAFEVARSLASCAPSTAASFLMSGPWPWQQEVVAQMARADVRKHLDADARPFAPAALSFICERLLADVEDRAGTPSGRAAQPARNWLSALAGKLRWTR